MTQERRGCWYHAQYQDDCSVCHAEAPSCLCPQCGKWRYSMVTKDQCPRCAFPPPREWGVRKTDVVKKDRLCPCGGFRDGLSPLCHACKKRRDSWASQKERKRTTA